MKCDERKLKILIACINLFFACSIWAAERGAEANRRNEQAFSMLKNAVQKSKEKHQLEKRLNKQLKDIKNDDNKDNENFKEANTRLDFYEYGDDYQKFLKGKLIYRGFDENHQPSKPIELYIRDLANPVEGTFDISKCGDAAENWVISTGYSLEKASIDTRNKVYIVFRPWVKREIKGAARHLKSVFPDKWPPEALVGIFWKTSDWDNPELFDYYLTNQDLSLLSVNTLFDKLNGSVYSKHGYAGGKRIEPEPKHPLIFFRLTMGMNNKPLTKFARLSPLFDFYKKKHDWGFNKERIYHKIPGSDVTWQKKIEDLWDKLEIKPLDPNAEKVKIGGGQEWRFDKLYHKMWGGISESGPYSLRSVVQLIFQSSRDNSPYADPITIDRKKAMEIINIETAAFRYLWQENSDNELWRHIAEGRITETKLKEFRQQKLIEDPKLIKDSFAELLKEALIRYPQPNTAIVPHEEGLADAH